MIIFLLIVGIIVCGYWGLFGLNPFDKKKVETDTVYDNFVDSEY